MNTRFSGRRRARREVQYNGAGFSPGSGDVDHLQRLTIRSPSCPARSIGRCGFDGDPGSVPDRPLNCILLRSGAHTAIDCGFRHRHQLRPHLGVEVECPYSLEHRHDLAQERREPLARRRVAYCPLPAQRPFTSSPYPGGRGFRSHLPGFQTQRRAQRLSGSRISRSTVWRATSMLPSGVTLPPRWAPRTAC